ncbi:hypothetical protein O1L60_33990 [Streptomyces diastatochromogenes]|nr:hypothetical protein [Streptomyces diastatochromogenes]
MGRAPAANPPRLRSRTSSSSRSAPRAPTLHRLHRPEHRTAHRPAATARRRHRPGPRGHRLRPGLYGGTRAIGSCDVERQVALLAADRTKAHAFAEAAGIPEGGVADWLRGLTPSPCAPTPASPTTATARARPPPSRPSCRPARRSSSTSTAPARPLRLRQPAPQPRRRPRRRPPGRALGRLRPDRVVTVRPADSVVTSLVIVNTTDRTWIERRTGTDGGEDRTPDVEPACDPDTCALTGSGTPDPTGPGRPASRTPCRPRPPPGPGRARPLDPAPRRPHPSGTGGTGTDPTAPTVPDPSTEPYPDPYTDPSTEPFPDPFGEPPGEQPTVPDGQLPPDELFPAGPEPERPETFQG